MVDKISQSMVSLAENNKDFKTALRFMLKCEVQMLLDRLSQLGDESLIIIANRSEESASHFGSGCAESYLQACASGLNLSIKDTFLKHCLETTPGAGFQPSTVFGGQSQMMNNNVSTMAAQGQMMNNNVSTMAAQGQMMNNIVSTMAAQGQMMNRNINNMAAQGQMMNANFNSMPGSMNEMMIRAAQMFPKGPQAGMMNRQTMGVGPRQQLQNANRFSPYQQPPGKTTGSSSKTSGSKQEQDLQINRAICRHFAKGHCWQGNLCAFLHVHQDPDSSEDKKTDKTVDSTAEDTASSSVETAKSTAFSNTAAKLKSLPP